MVGDLKLMPFLARCLLTGVDCGVPVSPPPVQPSRSPVASAAMSPPPPVCDAAEGEGSNADWLGSRVAEVLMEVVMDMGSCDV